MYLSVWIADGQSTHPLILVKGAEKGSPKSTFLISVPHDSKYGVDSVFHSGNLVAVMLPACTVCCP